MIFIKKIPINKAGIIFYVIYSLWRKGKYKIYNTHFITNLGKYHPPPSTNEIIVYSCLRTVIKSIQNLNFRSGIHITDLFEKRLLFSDKLPSDKASQILKNTSKNTIFYK